MTTELEKQMMEDAGAAIPSEDELKGISELAKDQVDLESKITAKEAELAILNQRLRTISENYLPAAMAAVGMTDFRLENGMRIQIKTDVFPSIRADFIEQAVKWLDEQGLGGIVKDEIKINLGRGEMELAEQILLFSKELGVSASEKMSVHSGTLKATVKDMRKKGVEFPTEYFSIADISKSVVK